MKGPSGKKKNFDVILVHNEIDFLLKTLKKKIISKNSDNPDYRLTMIGI